MPQRPDYSYRAVRRGLIYLLGGPAYTREIYASTGRLRLLASARRGTLPAAVAASIISTRRRQRRPEEADTEAVAVTTPSADAKAEDGAVLAATVPETDAPHGDTTAPRSRYH